MTAWRLSVRQRDGQVRDVVAETSETATIGAVWDVLAVQGFERSQLRIDGCRIDESTLLDKSPLRHGSIIGQKDGGEPPGPGWWLVAVAGPDTGRWVQVSSDPVLVGRNRANDLVVADPALSRSHFRVSIVDEEVAVDDLSSGGGTLLEGEPVQERGWASNGNYIAAGSTTFGIVHIESEAIAPLPTTAGATTAFQRRFRDALPALPATLRHPTAPTEESEANRRPLVSFFIPVITAVGMAMITGRYIFLLIIALGPVLYAIDGLRRRRVRAAKRKADLAAYEDKREAFMSELDAARIAERSRDRWSATPAGIAALLSQARHVRLWERSASDPDFCQVAIGLYERPSAVAVEQAPDGASFPLDSQWSAVLRHSLVGEGPLAVVGPMARARALLRALLLDLATSQSPHDVKIWLLSDAGEVDENEWNDLRWLPHSFLADAQNRIYTTAASRARAMSQLRSIVNQRLDSRRQERAPLPVHVVAVDCIGLLDHEELTDLVADGAPVGVVGVLLDSRVTPEGTKAQLSLGEFADEASFVSQSQPRADAVRSFEMATSTFAPAARSLAPLRPASSSRDTVDGRQAIRLAELIDAETASQRARHALERWRAGGASRVRVGGLGDLITEIDIMRDGPHGLVGGTTRSGKTEFLKSLITALAVENHPDDMSIVIVDFKGGVDHELSAMLPHVIDLSTNHDVDSFVRTVRLIEAELERRQRQFKRVGAPNFDAYRAARRRDASVVAVPRLLIIIDEFSELLSSESGRANLSSLESVTRVGGGLGVHLLLVTQNFENQLPSQIAANAGLRICFRVQEEAHSNAVLNSPEAASIPTEHIGRAFLRAHGGLPVEFQAGRVAGPRPGREATVAAAEARIVPLATVADPPPQAPIVDVPAEDTDMYSIVQVLQRAASLAGWGAPVVPWPSELPRKLTLDVLARSDHIWPLGLVDRPERQQQAVFGFEPYGAHTLLIGGPPAGLGDVLRALALSGATRRSPDELHYYVIDLLGQGLTSLGTLAHTGGVAERNEPLALRILHHIASEVASRKSRLASEGMATVDELRTQTDCSLPEVVVVIHGADRLLMAGEAQASPLLGPVLSLLADSVGSGVRILLSGPPSVAHHRLGAAIGNRFVFECADANDYSALGVPSPLRSGLSGVGRAADTVSGHQVQFAVTPTEAGAPFSEVTGAVAHRLVERWPPEEATSWPALIRELPWPLPLNDVICPTPPAGVLQPVALCVDTDAGELSWLDADEDGPTFVVCGPPKSGRSNALLAASELMTTQGWNVLGLPLSRRSPMGSDAFPGEIIDAHDLADAAGKDVRTALFIDDAHRWSGDASGLREFVDGPGGRAVVLAGPTEFFAGRDELVRALPSRCALVLSPRNSVDASAFGARRLSDAILRDQRPGRGVLVLAGEMTGAQAPFAD